jgi:hypothetical protein
MADVSNAIQGVASWIGPVIFWIMIFICGAKLLEWMWKIEKGNT